MMLLYMCVCVVQASVPWMGKPCYQRLTCVWITSSSVHIWKTSVTQKIILNTSYATAQNSIHVRAMLARPSTRMLLRAKKVDNRFAAGSVWVVQFTIQGSHRRPERNIKVDQSFGSDNDTCDIDFRLRRRVCRSVQLQIRGRKRSLTGRQ